MKRSTFISFGILTALWLAVAFINFPFGKYFIGWDALNPEFNYTLNFERVFSAFWQENQGLGLLGGHGFAAVLPHNIVIFLLDLVFPARDVRAIFTFLMLYAGASGVFVLCHKITKKDVGALVAGLFYMLNIGTLQMFYIQLEAFIVHFAALPWLLFATILFLEQPDKKHAVFLAFLAFAASTQGFIPPLFIAYLFATLILLTSSYVFNRTRHNLKRILTVLAIIFCMNAYWLIPFGYYTATRSSVYLNSYNNLISTPEFIDKNKKYGDFADVSLIRGFVFEALDSVENGNPVHVFEPWIQHYKNILVPLIGYGLFFLTIGGIIIALKRGANYITIGFIGIFLFFFTGITTDFPPFSYLTWLLQNYAPVYRQAFRAAFTKFSIGLSFSYSMFLGIVVAHLASRLSHRSRALVVMASLGLLVFYSFPTFQGSFFYKRLTLNVPQTYFDIMDYFRTADQNARIATLPQDCPEGWTTTRWGYTGSGFYWYGIKQPILDRAFDVWSNKNENYFWELTQLLRAREFDRLDAFFEKYAVKWILYDPNVIHCRTSKGLAYTPDLLDYLQSHPEYKKIKTFQSDGVAPIQLYERTNYKNTSFVSVLSQLPNVGPLYRWNDLDIPFYSTGQYQTDKDIPYDFYYPFRSIFSKRRAEDREFIVEEGYDYFMFRNLIPSTASGMTVSFPNLLQTESIVFAQLQIEKLSERLSQLKLEYILPTILIDNEAIFDGERVKPSIALVSFNPKKTATLTVSLNEISFPIPDITDTSTVYSLILATRGNNKLTILDQNEKILLSENITHDPASLDIFPKNIVVPQGAKELSIKIPKLFDSRFAAVFTKEIPSTIPYPCNELVPSGKNKYKILEENQKQFLRMDSLQNRHCVSFTNEKLPHGVGYLVTVETRKISGRNPSLYITNNLSRVSDLDVYLNGTDNFTNHYFILPPVYPYGFGRTVYFDSYSLTNQPTINDLARLELWPIPYNFLKSIQFDRKDQLTTYNLQLTTNFSVSHPNPAFYQIQLPTMNDERRTLILYQSFDPGWKAYEMPNCQLSTINCQLKQALPFFFGKEIKEHVLVNNWANAWRLNAQERVAFSVDRNTVLRTNDERTNERTIVIFFLPQLLQWLGFALLPIPFLYILLEKKN